MKIFITGASGFIGTALRSELLQNGHTIVGYSRKPKQQENIAWTTELNPTGCDAIVHLAGESVLGFWTQGKKQRILDSRVEPLRELYRVVSAMPADQRPKTLVSTSGTSAYESDLHKIYDEGSPMASSFLGEVIKQWEAAARAFEELGLRVVILRLGAVLSPTGGILPTLLRAAKFGANTTFGGGHAWFPWVDLQDVVRMFASAVSDPRWRGVFNAVAPHAVTQREFAEAIADVTHHDVWNIPAWALKIVPEEMAQGLILTSQHVIPKHATDIGYPFEVPHLQNALRTLGTHGDHHG